MYRVRQNKNYLRVINYPNVRRELETAEKLFDCSKIFPICNKTKGIKYPEFALNRYYCKQYYENFAYRYNTYCKILINKPASFYNNDLPLLKASLRIFSSLGSEPAKQLLECLKDF